MIKPIPKLDKPVDILRFLKKIAKSKKVLNIYAHKLNEIVDTLDVNDSVIVKYGIGTTSGMYETTRAAYLCNIIINNKREYLMVFPVDRKGKVVNVYSSFSENFTFYPNTVH